MTREEFFKALSCPEIYAVVEDENGLKTVVVYGWFYFGDNWIWCSTGYPGACVFEIGDITSDEDAFAQEVLEWDEYETDLPDEDSALYLFKNFAKEYLAEDGKDAPKPLPITEVSQITPCGLYINIGDISLPDD